jgi:hypothetical protein
MYYLLPYVLMFPHFVHSVLLLLILYSVPLMYYCSRIVNFYETLPLGIGPIAVSNIYIYIYRERERERERDTLSKFYGSF